MVAVKSWLSEDPAPPGIAPCQKSLDLGWGGSGSEPGRRIRDRSCSAERQVKALDTGENREEGVGRVVTSRREARVSEMGRGLGTR